MPVDAYTQQQYEINRDRDMWKSMRDEVLGKITQEQIQELIEIAIEKRLHFSPVRERFVEMVYEMTGHRLKKSTTVVQELDALVLERIQIVDPKAHWSWTVLLDQGC